MACLKYKDDYWYMQADQINEEFNRLWKEGVNAMDDATYDKSIWKAMGMTKDRAVARVNENHRRAARIWNKAFEEDMKKKGTYVSREPKEGETSEEYAEQVRKARDRDKLWNKEAYKPRLHTVAECEAVIKDLREMIDKQQEYIYKLQLQLNGRSDMGHETKIYSGEKTELQKVFEV